MSSNSCSQSASPYTGHFAENFYWGNTLGEGGNSIVKLVYNPQTEQRMACKIFDSKEPPNNNGYEANRQDRLRQVRKEYMMLKLVESSPHENVCKFLGVRQADDTYFMFFELLTGGELFNHIVPDVGIPASLAKMYFVQICRAIGHLQSLGMAHRDIKCENCLLTGDLRTLKVTDFGWATIYRSQGVVRTLVGVAGTEPYMCPEMHAPDRPYRAEPVDYWSAGVVLIAMLTGEMPWDRAHSSEPHFVAWVQGNNHLMPFDRLTAEQLTFLRRLLCLRPSKRLYGEAVLQHPWIRSRDLPEPTRARGVTPQASSSQSVASSFNLARSDPYSGPALLSPSVFAAPIESPEEEAAAAAAAAAAKNPPQMTGGFTQPARLQAVAPLGCATQAALAAAHSPAITASQLDSDEMQPIGLHRMALRLTRFFTTTDAAATQEELLKALGMVSELRVTQQDRGAIHVTTTLPGTYPVSFKICLYLVRSSNILVEFRRTAGSGLRFNQLYQRLHSLLKHIISQDVELCGLLQAAAAKTAAAAAAATAADPSNPASSAAADGNASFMDCTEDTDTPMGANSMDDVVM